MDVLFSLFQPPFIRKTSSDRQRLKADCEGTWEARLKGGWEEVLSLLTGWLSACFDKNVRMNGKEVMTDLVGRGVICSYIKNMPSFLKKMVMFLRNITIFLENIKVFFAAWACVKTKPRPYEPKDSIVHVLTHPPVCKVCTYASGYTYGGISLHVYTHRATHIYASVYTYVCN